MAQLYRSKWRSQEGDIFKGENEFSDGFLLWCKKTEGLTDEQWKHGFDTLERDIREAERLGDADSLWPPSYPAFIEKCQIRYARGHRPFADGGRLEDKTAKERRKEIGKQECAKLLSMFND